MNDGMVTSAYIIAAILFILSLAGLSRQETARRGNRCGIAGMAIAVVATIFSDDVSNYGLLLVLGAVGAALGITLAKRVEMTGMPELVAILHSLVGLAAVLVGFATYLDPGSHYVGTERTIHDVEIYLGVLIGALTFTGSVVAYGKLSGKIGSKPLMLDFRHKLNIGIGLGCLVLLFMFVAAAPDADLVQAGAGFVEDKRSGTAILLLMTLLAFAFGVHMVMAIGGADMPVVISMLNSYSGWAAAAAGFMLSNDLLIVVGALVGSSGAILSYIMCRAMNRKFLSVIMGGWGDGASASSSSDDDEEQGEAVPIQADGVAELLRDADSVVIVPGYGMAVAHAQHPVAELTRKLKDGGERALRDPPGRRAHARAHERAARRGERALRPGARDGRDQRRARRHRRRHRHRRERHREPLGDGRPGQPDRRHAGARGLEGEERHRLQARHGHGLRRRREPAVLPRQHPDALRRREGQRLGACCRRCRTLADVGAGTRMLFGDAKDSVSAVLSAL